MPNFAEVRLEGHLGKDAEMRTTKNGKSVLSFSLATTEKYQDKEETTWWNVNVWGKNAEWLSLKKGDAVHVVGTPKLSTFKKNDGSTGTSLEVTSFRCHKIEFSKSDSSLNQPQDTSEDNDGLPF